MSADDQPLLPWPDVDDGTVAAADKAKVVFDAEVEVAAGDRKARQDRVTEAVKEGLARESSRLTELAAENQAVADGYRATAAADRAADLANLDAFFTAMTTMATGAVERARAGAEVVQKASAAIATLYTGILAFAFAADGNRLPARGVLAPVFLGLAVVLSSAYLAYLGPGKGVTAGPAPVAGVEPRVFERLDATVTAASAIATRRSYALRASVIALGVGLVYIVLPFVTLADPPAAATPSAASATTPAWPSPTAGIPDALNAIVYKAQVDEAARQRQQAEAPHPNEVSDTTALGVLGLLGLALTFGVPLLWRSAD
jgi:hypothetical protein